jgi:polysaccharide export outer membrane protein
MRPYLFVVSILIFSAGCVSNKKVQMLQKNDVNKKGLVKDSILRTYAIDTFNYKLQPNDLISVRFESLTPKDYNFLSTNSQNINTSNLAQGGGLLIGDLVDESGEIPFPVIGKVKVSGLTVFQAQEKLQKVAENYIEAPIVKVRLLNYRITLLGEVGGQGTVTLNSNRISMLEAIAHVGGFTELADRSNIKLIRQKGNTTEVAYINLLDENFFKSPYYYVYQNDVLIVPPLKQRPFRNYFATNLSLVVSTLTLFLLIYNLTN